MREENPHPILDSLIIKPENEEILALLQAHDMTSYTHSVSVASISEVLFPYFEFKGITDPTDIIEGALLHDVGKLFVPEKILNKDGKLTPLEYSIVKEHPRCGGMLLYDRSEIIRNIVHFHHERLDGSGYPYGLRSDQIPDYCRFITMIDILDALLSPRAYKPAMPVCDIYDEIFRMYNGKNLDMYYFTKMFEYLNLKEYLDHIHKGEEAC